jgi:hypothetical protein
MYGFAQPLLTTGLTAQTAVTNASAAVTLPSAVPADGVTARIVATGTAAAFIRFDGTAAALTTAMRLLPGVVETFTLTQAMSLTCIAAANGTTTIDVTFGGGQ